MVVFCLPNAHLNHSHLLHGGVFFGGFMIFDVHVWWELTEKFLHESFIFDTRNTLFSHSIVELVFYDLFRVVMMLVCRLNKSSYFYVENNNE